MRILIHICCGPCAITVLDTLVHAGHDVTGFFFNPNIQPLAEYLRRREAAEQVAKRCGIQLVQADTLDEPGPLVPWLPELPGAVNPLPWLHLALQEAPQKRCTFCWEHRLRRTAAFAVEQGFEGISSTLLYSRYQNHEQLRVVGEQAAQDKGLIFVYQDFRLFWQEGIARAKEWGVYRQPYCGCLFSEYERYAKAWKRAAYAGESGAKEGT